MLFDDDEILDCMFATQIALTKSSNFYFVKSWNNSAFDRISDELSRLADKVYNAWISLIKR